VAVKLYLSENITQPNPEENVTQTVGSYLVNLMIRCGVRNIYGIVGDSANPVIDAIRKSDGKLRFITVRNEEAGAFAAGADSQVSGCPTAVIGSSGPGSHGGRGERNRLCQCVSGSLGVKRAISPILSMSPTKACGWVVTEARLRLGTSL